jgi:hypothetical protein
MRFRNLLCVLCRNLLCVLCLVLSSPTLVLGADSSSPVYFDQPASAKLFEEAEVKGQFWTLVRYFISQRIDTFCSVASSVMVLNALEVPSPISPMTHPYNKFDEQNFFTWGVLEAQKVRNIAGDGIFLSELGGMLKAHGVTVDTYHADTLSLAQFRTMAVAALGSTDRYIVVNFVRTKVGQDGGGHFSPLAAYNQKSDRFLMLDVARYKYPPMWVKAEDLWDAMNTVDTDAKAKRGFVIISRGRQ